MADRIGRAGALLALLALIGTPARAATVARCAASKERVAGKKATALASCDAHAVAKGVAADPRCTSAARGRFASSWQAVERRGGCGTTGDVTAIENKVDAFVADLEARLGDGAPPSRCAAGKFKDAGKAASCGLACTARGAARGLPVSDASVTSCRVSCDAKLQGGFRRDEGRGSCHTTGDAGSVSAAIAAFVDDVSGEFAPSTTTTTTPTVTTTTAATFPGGVFEAPNPWNTSVATDPKSSDSDRIIAALAAAGGWGGGVMRIDFSIELLTGDASTPFRDFTPTSDFFTPDCDHVPFPVPPGGALEGESGYECTTNGDCHLLVVHPPTKTLYEMWRANIVGSDFRGGCAVVWDLTRSYPPNLRGEGCTSADAGGFPIAAMLFSADEVASGTIAHAVRFILPNSRIRRNVYVHPGTHSTGATSGGPDLPPYGVRFRLRRDFPLTSLPSDGARVVARALQDYGMFLADGGTIALTAQSDRFTAHKWADVLIDSHALQAIQVTDMEVVDLGTPITWDGNCVRNP